MSSSINKVQPQQMEEEMHLSKSGLKQTPSRLKGSLLRTTIGKNEQRLIVKQIVLENFKSYQGRQVIGPFHKRFTSVVGPNGSGKSNLIESLLFVFGKKASWMRLKKLEQLIHNSSKHQNIKKASVEVTFHEIIDKEGDDYEVLPDTEFTVRRTVNKSSVSKYEINDKEASHQEVTDLLKSKGIDLTNNRFLILQGEVEQISLMKPRSGDVEKPGLLEYLEDIIGSNQFKEDIEKKDEEYENERREKGERMRIHEADLEKLSESKNLAIEYVRNEKQSYQILNIVGQIDLQRARKDAEKYTARIALIEKQDQEEKERFNEQMRKNETLIQEYKKKKVEVEKKELEFSKHVGMLQKLTKKDEQNRQKLVLESENQTKIEKVLEELQKDYNNVLRDSKDYEKQLPSKQDKLKKLSEEKDEEDEKLREIKHRVNAENSKFVKEKKDLEKQLQPIKENKLDVQQRRDNLQNRLNLISSDSATIQAEFDRTNLEIQKANQNITEQQTVAVKVTQAVEAIEAKVEEQDRNNRELKTIEERILKAVAECKQRIDQTKQANYDNQSRNKVLNELMIAQQQGKLRGICGRLGDLAAISEEYDVAITTACGQLDNIIVERYDDAQSAVNYLRKEKIGRAQFIALDKMDHVKSEMERGFQCPSGSRRLFDLIQFKDNKYKQAFYFSIRNTLVCDNIDLATEIGYGQYRHRVVTKRGELIESTGVMSGGGQARKGGMASKLKTEISPEEIARLQEECVRNEEDLGRVREKINSSQNDIEVLVKDQIYLRKELENKKFSIQISEDSLARNANRLKALQKQMREADQNQAEQETILRDLERLSKEYTELDKIIMELGRKITEVEDKINKQGGHELKAQAEKCKTLTQAYNELQSEVNKMSAKLKDTEKTLKLNEKEKRENQERIVQIVEQIKVLKENEKKIEEEATQVYQAQKKAEEELLELKKGQQECDDQKRKIQAMIKERKDTMEKYRKEKEESENKINKAKDDQVKYENQISHNRLTYKEITKSYDFLQFLDEIANYTVSENEPAKPQDPSGLDQISLLEETKLQRMEEEDQSDDEKDEEVVVEKNKRLAVSKTITNISSIDVMDDIPLNVIEQLENHRESLKMQKANAEEKLKNLGNEANITTISEFKNKYIEFKTKKEEFEKVKARIQELKSDADRLKKERFEKFMSGFNLISAKLKETYQTLTNGGDAELELIDSLDPFSDGVNFTVRPPKKSWKQISKLSGGEKTLSSLSLVFALHYYKPTPLYFMDEIDAALDFKNVSIVGKYVQERTKNAQFIIISLRNNMFELANKLVGVYKTYDATKTIAIIPELINQKIALLNKDQDQQQELNDNDEDEDQQRQRQK